VANESGFAEKYDLLRKLGEGGMAEIFLARQRGIGGFHKELVIKRIRREFAQNERYVELFLDEARIAANLNHPNIVHIYDIGKAYGSYYIAMEYIHGADLMDILREGIKQKKFMPLEFAVEIISQVSEGLHFAHTFRDESGMPLSIVHRDISPSNILVTYSGLAKLVDFGIAKAATQVHDDDGQIMGKVNYMAPEQLRGEEVDARSDLFGLGVVLYEITAGRRLFRGAGHDVRKKILDDPVPPPSVVRPDYPLELEVIVMRLLEKRPENRYGDAEELHQDLQEFLADTGGRNLRARISRYLMDLYDLDGLPIELEEDVLLEAEEEELNFDQPAGAFDDDFADDEEVIFASRLPDSLSGETPAGDPNKEPTAPPPGSPPEVKEPREQQAAKGGPSSAVSPETRLDEDPLAALDVLGSESLDRDGQEYLPDHADSDLAPLGSPFATLEPVSRSRWWLWLILFMLALAIGLAIWGLGLLGG